MATTINRRHYRPLRDAWSGPLDIASITRRYGYSPMTIRRFWASERAAGRLPAFPAPRPHFASVSTPPFPASSASAEAYAIDPDAERIFAREAAGGDDGAPFAIMRGADALLMALEREHGADLHRYEADEATLDDRRAPSKRAALLADMRRHDAARLNAVKGGVACPA